MIIPPKHILPIIVIAQFFCTSLWFAGNGVIADLVIRFDLQESALSHLTSAVQFGFISGTLLFALLTIVDRFSPSKVFLFSACMGALFNLGVVWEAHRLGSLLFLRFMTGFFLAGIYPVGMKIAADYFQKGLGRSLGYLVGALVLGTALPHLLKGATQSIPWQAVLYTTSGLACIGGIMMWYGVPDGPHRKAGQQLDLTAFFRIFKNINFRSAAFGYFGHMWELYAFWAFVPVMLSTYNSSYPETNTSESILAFSIIGIGGIACVISGYLSQTMGTQKTAFGALSLSGICCLLSPFIFSSPNQWLFLSFLFFWGMVVIADSPLFSTMVAQNAPTQIKGTALTIVNCIGFAITIISIQLINALRQVCPPNLLFLVLAIGPLLGLIALSKHRDKHEPNPF